MNLNAKRPLQIARKAWRYVFRHQRAVEELQARVDALSRRLHALESPDDPFSAAAADPHGPRSLAVYDIPDSLDPIGDILMLQHAAGVLWPHAQGEVDVAVVVDPAAGSRCAELFSSELLPLIQNYPGLGSMFVFDSPKQLQEFVGSQPDGIRPWPSPGSIRTSAYLRYQVLDQLIPEFLRRNGNLSTFSTDRETATSAEFLAQIARPFVTVSLSDGAGEANLESWIRLFDYCEAKYSIPFVLLDHGNDPIPQLRRCSKVISTRDHHLSTHDARLLMSRSVLHVGHPRGLGAAAWLGPTPVLFDATKFEPSYFQSLVQEGAGYRFRWLNIPHDILLGNVTFEVLRDAFTRIWNACRPTWLSREVEGN